MKLKHLLKELPDIVIKGSKEIEISGVTSNSKRVSPGNLFIAKKGNKSDGTDFIPEACRAGAVAVLTDIYDPSLKNVVQLIHPEISRMEGLVALSYYQRPSKELWMAAVTGTNGKTTTSYALKHVLESCGVSCGLIGSIEYLVGRNRYPATHTTPDVCANLRFLREMCTQGCTASVMEVTSHALQQDRVAHIDFDVAIFTNLNHEHLDYHKTMEQYFEAKARLIQGLASDKVALINADDPWAKKFIAVSKARVVTYGIDEKADIQATEIHSSTNGSRFCVSISGKKQRFSWPLVGRFNVYNALACIGAALTKGLESEAIARALESFQTVPGRLDPVENSLGLHIFVDYAHKSEALKNVLQTLKGIAKGRIITLFGCGGDRDREKRPLMAKTSEMLSDITIVTSDNPRSEDPVAIATEIASGFSKPEQHFVELDRKKAIYKAIELARDGDIVLIAGKGHETQQIFANRVIEFDDKKVAKECCEQLFSKRKG